MLPSTHRGRTYHTWTPKPRLTSATLRTLTTTSSNRRTRASGSSVIRKTWKTLTPPTPLRAPTAYGYGLRIVDEPELFESGSTRVDELLDEAPTPVDEVLEAGEDDIENAELFQTQMMDSQPTEESAELFRTQEIDTTPSAEHADLFAAQEPDDDSSHEPFTEEMRFDDNTPLPDDFLDDDTAAEEVSRAPAAAAVEPSPPPADVQNQFALSEPDEWEQLLDEFDDLLGPDANLSTDSNGSADAVERESADDSIEAELISAAFDNDQPASDQMNGAESSIEEDLMSAAFDVEAVDDDAADTAVSDLADSNAERGRRVDCGRAAGDRRRAGSRR